ncbi:MAG: hypothetical protein LUC24_05350 [Bacteroidales bacterium]|nr:hypothetical protein [Bacteroidales bacterium]
MPAASLNRGKIQVDDGLASIVIIKDLGDLPGGRTLDVSGVADDVKVLKAGHILVQNDATGAVSPLGVTTDETTSKPKYEALPEGCSYVGVLKANILVEDARAAVLTIGQVNAAASPVPVTDEIVKGLPLVQFLHR